MSSFTLVIRLPRFLICYSLHYQSLYYMKDSFFFFIIIKLFVFFLAIDLLSIRVNIYVIS